MTTARAFGMPAEQARQAAEAAAEGNPVDLTDPAGHRLAAVVPTDTALVLATAAQTRQRLAAFEAAAPHQHALTPDEATTHMLARGDGPPGVEDFTRVLRAEGHPAEQIPAEAQRLAIEAAPRSA
jgi:hypothetical protein